MKRQADGVLWGVIVETEAYSRTIPPVMATAAVHRKQNPFGERGRFYVYISIPHCVNVVTVAGTWLGLGEIWVVGGLSQKQTRK